MICLEVQKFKIWSGNGNLFQYSYLENSMDKEPGGVQSMGLQRAEHD